MHSFSFLTSLKIVLTVCGILDLMIDGISLFICMSLFLNKQQALVGKDSPIINRFSSTHLAKTLRRVPILHTFLLKEDTAFRGSTKKLDLPEAGFPNCSFSPEKAQDKQRGASDFGMLDDECA